MSIFSKPVVQILLPVYLFLCSLHVEAGTLNDSSHSEPSPTSTQEEAIRFIDNITSLSTSEYWPNVKPALFLQNIKINIHQPLSMYAGRGTNFCGYGALAYLLLQDDPLGYAKFMLTLYKDGKAIMGSASFNPSTAIKRTAGTLKYKGLLDIRPAEQMLYLTLADHFKGYLNIFKRHYDMGDENRFWASVNYAKFNRMIRQMLHYKVNARGNDLMQPWVGNTYDYITSKMKEGIVVLFVNNRVLHKKKHEKIKFGVPTHFVILKNIIKTTDLITLVYWDYGHKTLLQLKPEFLHKIVFGITQCIKKIPDEK